MIEPADYIAEKYNNELDNIFYKVSGPGIQNYEIMTGAMLIEKCLKLDINIPSIIINDVIIQNIISPFFQNNNNLIVFNYAVLWLTDFETISLCNQFNYPIPNYLQDYCG